MGRGFQVGFAFPVGVFRLKNASRGKANICKHIEGVRLRASLSWAQAFPLRKFRLVQSAAIAITPTIFGCLLRSKGVEFGRSTGNLP